MTIDLLPTIARLAGTRLPANTIDGKDIWPLLAGEAGAKGQEAYFIYWERELQAMRSGPWKLHFKHSFVKPNPAGGGGRPGKYATLKVEKSLFNLADDPGELKDVADKNPEVVQRLTSLAEKVRIELGDSATGHKGRGVRQAGMSDGLVRGNR
jgi:arylsulfatase A-like enzyme